MMKLKPYSNFWISMMKAKILTPATAEQVATAQMAQHIRPNQLNRLVSQMTGVEPYAPRLGGSGQKLKCRRDYCNNYAIENGRKQLCPAHYAHFLERSNAAQALPRCVRCNTGTNRIFEGQQMCPTCERAEENHREEVLAERDKFTQLDNAETVEDLREWIKEYVL
jgi:hypothetical protein